MQINHFSALHVQSLHSYITFRAWWPQTPAVYSNTLTQKNELALKPPTASILVWPAVMSNSAGGVMTAVARGAHKLRLVSVVSAANNMTQVWHKAGVCSVKPQKWLELAAG